MLPHIKLPHIKKSQGFTFIELLVVISLVAIIGATASPFLLRFMIRNNHDTTLDNLKSTIRKAQLYSMDKKDGTTWGICVDNNKLKLFSGSCASPSHQETFSIPSTISISGLPETTFNSDGEPSTTLSITLVSDDGNQTITLNEVGGLDE